MNQITQPTILIIDDDTEIRYSLHRVLSSREYAVEQASSGEEGIVMAEKLNPMVVFLDNRMKGMSGLETLQHLRSVSPHAMVILMTAFGTTQTAIEAMKYGAFDYIIKPFDIKKVLSLTEKAVQAHRDLSSARREYSPVLNVDDYKEGIVGSSDPMQEVFKVIGQVAASEVTVMITGESGTGKELVARCIYQHSLRADKPFMAVNCAAIPENLIESELFGHEKGSFTGAANQRLGKFELCDGGTLFLDEIGDMVLPVQTKILRALQEGEIQRVGGTSTIKVDVRLIAATNKPLEKMVEDKTFREDLYYRLNVMRIQMPGLRERSEDIPALVDYMLQRLRKERKTKVTQLSPEAMALLLRYPWPGNVRELENVIHRSAVIVKGETILPKDLPREIQGYVGKPGEVTVVEPVLNAPTVALPPTVDSGSGEDFRSELRLNQPPVTPSGSFIVEPVSSAVAEQVDADEGDELTLELATDQLYAMLRKEVGENILQAVEDAFMDRVLKETGGNQVRASNILGITRATLRKRIEQNGLKY